MTVFDAIEKNRKLLNKNENYLLKYILENTEKVSNMRIQDLSKETFISTATIVRFCNKLSYSGYAEFKANLKSSIDRENNQKIVPSNTFLFDDIAKTKDLINVCIVGYFLITAFALQLDKAWEFWFLAVCVAVFQGAIQSLSRSYYAKIIPKEKSSEYFGFYDIFGKGASFTGTMLMGIFTQITGTSRAGVALICLMFILGFLIFQQATRIQRQEVSLNG